MRIEDITKGFTSLPRFYKRIIIALSDSVLLVTALWLSFSLRLGVFYFPQSREVSFVFLMLPVLAIPIFIRFGLYSAIIRYIGFRALWSVLKAVSLYAITLSLLFLLVGAQGVPRSVIVINWLVAMLFIGGTRMVARWWLVGAFNEMSPFTNKPSKTKVAIYGAGSAGVQLANALSYSNEYQPVAFLDDKSELHNTHVNTLRVYPFSTIGTLIPKLGIQEVLLAIPTASRRRRNHIIEMLEKYPVYVRMLPSMSELAGGQVKVEDVKEVGIEDLLGRDPVKPFPDLLHANILNKVVMVTGAGGSIGSELCRQILQQKPKKIILFEVNEFALYSIESELKAAAKESEDNIVAILGNALDQDRFRQVCKTYQINTIYHAAAYKHVPLVEKNPLEAIRNNIIGTLVAAQSAVETGVETFVLISTDKAVRPTNVMGASKRFAELILQALAEIEQNTRFCMVRFGNVLGSSGSVVPLFREQIHKGGPVTVTHPDIIRYFMTIPEAAQLVIQAGAMGNVGDVFLLDMGEPVRINDLARKMIHLSGLTVEDEQNPGGDIRIEYTGLRPGEKLYEELLIAGNPVGTKHPRIYRARESHIAWPELKDYLDVLEKGLDAGDVEMVLTLLLNVVADYHPQGTIEDSVWKEKRKGKDNNTVVQLKDFRSPQKPEPDASSN
jgi:FlaA1/EpsC-like NDP-sugar epimerase